MTLQEWKIFQDVPEEIDETWRHVALFGGMVDLAKTDYSLACDFKHAGDILISRGLNHHDREAYELLYPVLYLYRHAIELYLKAIIRPKKRDHNLGYLFAELEKLLSQHYGVDVLPIKFRKPLEEMINHDPRATTFRYADVETNAPEEVIVDLPALLEIMDYLAITFRQIYLAEKQRLGFRDDSRY
ncbi:MAG: hypothetical protein SF029_21670 [bacterium]|nr:hypothetical protein [bacterium]